MMRQYHPLRMRRAQGFTLFELMVTMGLVAIVMAIGAPQLTELVRSQRIKAASVAVMTTMTAARSEAMRFGVEVSVVAPGNDFNQGWCVVFGSTAGCNLSNPDPNVMKVQEPLPRVTMPTGVARVVFTRSGRLAAPLTVSIADDQSPPVVYRCVQIEVSGAVASREPTSGACT